MADYNGSSGPDNYTGTADSDFIRGNAGGDMLNGEGGSDNIFGGLDNDTISGGDGDDFLYGEAGDDSLSGESGNDFLRGGAGVDTFDGGSEPPLSFTPFSFGDRISFSEARATTGAVADLRTGIVENDGYGNRETMTGIESFTGNTAFADRLYGNDGMNFLSAGSGDVIMAFGGADFVQAAGAPAILDGGAGSDFLLLLTSGGFVPDSNGDGSAEIRPQMTAGWKLDLALGTMTDGYGETGEIAAFESIQGTELDDVLRGDGAANAFHGGDGSDLLEGRGGGDRLDGGAGDDILDGGDGNDILLDSEGEDEFSGGAGRDVFYLGNAFTSVDRVDGGGNADIVILQGNYLAPMSLAGIANLGNLGSISLFSSGNDLYGGAAPGLANYNLVATDDNVAAGQILKINAAGLQEDEDVTFDGSAELDGSFQYLGGLGTDDVTGGAAADNFIFANGSWGAGDRVSGGGGGGYDVVYLRGDYAFTFGATQLADVESVGLLSASDTRFGSGGGDGEYDYEIDWNDAMLDAGQILTVNGSRLGAEESIDFDGTVETAGSFRLFGGGGSDVLRGGAGADLIVGGDQGDTVMGGGGNDIFRYQSVTDSNGNGQDGIQDFAQGDRIDVARIDADILTDGDQAFTFIGSAAFSGKAGELRYEGSGFLVSVQGDVDGDGVADFMVAVVIPAADPLTALDFML